MSENYLMFGGSQHGTKVIVPEDLTTYYVPVYGNQVEIYHRRTFAFAHDLSVDVFVFERMDDSLLNDLMMGLLCSLYWKYVEGE